MPGSDSVTERVLEAIARVKHIPRESVSEGLSFAELGFDSLDTINLLFELEEDFKISIPDEEARKSRVVADVVAAIRLLTQSPAVESASEPAA